MLEDVNLLKCSETPIFLFLFLKPSTGSSWTPKGNGEIEVEVDKGVLKMRSVRPEEYTGT